MDTLTAITTRASALRLGDPGPTPGQLAAILAAGSAAPDHGRLSPWRFVVLEGDKREVLARALVAMRRRLSPELSAEEVEREGQKALRAPAIIAVAARVTPPVKGIPEIERIMAAAAATQNMMLAAHAQGLGAMWKTGQAAYDAGVKLALGLNPEDHIVAFFYVGTTTLAGKPRQADPAEFVISP